MKQLNLLRSVNLDNTFDIEMSELRTVSSQKFDTMTMSIPLGGINRNVVLKRVNIFSENFKVTTSEGVNTEWELGEHYRGEIEGEEKSFCSLSFTNNEIFGHIVTTGSTYDITFVSGSTYRTYNVNEENSINFKCHHEPKEGQIYSNPYNPSLNTKKNTGLKSLNPYVADQATRLVKIDWVADYDIYFLKGANTVAYITSIFNASKTLFENDGIFVVLNFLHVFTTGFSPYRTTPLVVQANDACGSNSCSMIYMLFNFRYSLGNNIYPAGTTANDFSGDLQHLLTANFPYSFVSTSTNKISGLADGIQVLCNPISSAYTDNDGFLAAFTDSPVCFSQIDVNALPNSTTYSSTVQVITHEQGHLMGSNHTHGCYWNTTNFVPGGNPIGCSRIDSCVTENATFSGCSTNNPIVGVLVNGNCSNPGIPPNSGGTIMSYCALVGGGSQLFSNGFGPQPQQRIVNFINSLSCLQSLDTTPTPTPTLTLTPTPTMTMTPSTSVGTTPNPTQTQTATRTTTPTVTPTITKTSTPTQSVGSSPNPTTTPTLTPTNTITRTNTRTKTATPTNTPTITPSNNDECSNCTDQYPCPTQTQTPTQTQICDTTVLSPSTNPVSPVPLGKFNNAGYTNIGTRFYVNGFQFGGSGSTYYFSNTSDVWKSTNSTNGPLNRSGIWSIVPFPANTWIGFSVCVEVLDFPNFYYVGFGADNAFRLTVDGIETINTTLGGYNNSTLAFSNWHVYPIPLYPGNHVLNIYGLNLTQTTSGVFGCEIYLNTINELTAATSTNDLNIIFSTNSYSESNADIVQNSTGLQLTSGYTCPSGYVYQSCQNNCVRYIPCPEPTFTPTPTKTKTSTPTIGLSPNPTPTQTPSPTKCCSTYILSSSPSDITGSTFSITRCVGDLTLILPVSVGQSQTITCSYNAIKLSGLGNITQLPGCICNQPTPNPTSTPTPTSFIDLGPCFNRFIPPFTSQGVNVTMIASGDVLFPNTFTGNNNTCGIILANNPYTGLALPGIYAGFTDSPFAQPTPQSQFIITFNFSIPINELTIVILGCGTYNWGGGNEVFLVTTDTEIPTITSSFSCFSTINGNEIRAGAGILPPPIGPGGGLYTITCPTDYTSVTISGAGGYDGSNIAICDFYKPGTTKTPTPTQTKTPTRTPVTPTVTSTSTLTPTQTETSATQTPTTTRTQTRTPNTPTPTKTKTNTPTNCCSDYQVSKLQGFSQATYTVDSCQGQSGTFTYTGNSFITVQCAKNVINVDGASIVKLPGCGCSTPPPTPTMTPTPLTQCSNIVFSENPITINGITINIERTGNTYVIPSPSPSFDFSNNCGFNFTVQYPALLLGNGLNGIGITGPPSFFSNWSLSINFSQPITSITIALIDGGCTCQFSPNDPENFWFTTNTGIPTITPVLSCNSVISNNEIILSSTNPSWLGGETGNGIFTISNCNGFTNLTMTGDGGYLGTVFGICDTSINTNPCTTPTPTPTKTKTPTPTPTSNQNEIVECGQYLRFDESLTGIFYYTLNIGDIVGTIQLDINALSVPDLFQVYWDGNLVIDTGFLGDSQFDAQLIALGYPPTVGYSYSSYTFTKTSSFPQTATLVTTSPIIDTQWEIFMICNPIIDTNCPVLFSSQDDWDPFNIVNKIWYYDVSVNQLVPILSFNPPASSVIQVAHTMSTLFILRDDTNNPTVIERRTINSWNPFTTTSAGIILFGVERRCLFAIDDNTIITSSDFNVIPHKIIRYDITNDTFTDLFILDNKYRLMGGLMVTTCGKLLVSVKDTTPTVLPSDNRSYILQFDYNNLLSAPEITVPVGTSATQIPGIFSDNGNLYFLRYNTIFNLGTANIFKINLFYPYSYSLVGNTVYNPKGGTSSTYDCSDTCFSPSGVTQPTPTSTPTQTKTPTNTLTQTQTKTPTKTQLSNICAGRFIAPTTHNGVNVTFTSNGDVIVALSPIGLLPACGQMNWNGIPAYMCGGFDNLSPTPASSFSLTFNFDLSVNNVSIVMTQAGWGGNENFVFTTNTGIPTISSTFNCYSTISGNQVISGAGAPQTPPNGPTGGAGVFIINNTVPYTSLTITGAGGYQGAFINICDFEVIPVTQTPTPTKTSTPTATQTLSPTKTSTPTNTSTPTRSVGATPPPTNSQTPTNTATNTATVTQTPTNTSTQTPTKTATSTVTPTPTRSAGSTPPPTNTQTSTPTTTNTVTQTPTKTTTQTPTKTATQTSTQTQTPTKTSTSTGTPTQTPTKTKTPTQTATPTTTLPKTPDPTPTNTLTPTNTKTSTQTPTNTKTPTPTPTSTPPCQLPTVLTELVAGTRYYTTCPTGSNFIVAAGPNQGKCIDNITGLETFCCQYGASIPACCSTPNGPCQASNTSTFNFDCTDTEGVRHLRPVCDRIATMYVEGTVNNYNDLVGKKVFANASNVYPTSCSCSRANFGYWFDANNFAQPWYGWPSERVHMKLVEGERDIFGTILYCIVDSVTFCPFP